MTPLLYVPVLLPALVAALCAMTGYRPWAAWLAVFSALTQLGTGAVLATAVVPASPISAGPLRADALAAFMLLLIGAVATIATWSGVHHLADTATHATATATGGPAADTVGARRHLVLVQLFLAAMAIAVLADNLGLVWVALEATTIVTAFLVGYRRDRAGAEAAWKYMVLCSVGIALAFLATVCLNIAAVRAGGHGFAALNWSQLYAHADALDHDVLRLAAALAVLGFGTKAGLAPMHAWLPDAHSQAPAPVSALMSGVLLAIAFTQILRYKAITDAALGPAHMRALLVAAALASLLVAASLLIGQRDYKRMLAYSSIEHMGLAALGAAIGSRLAVTAVLLHLLGHGLGKAVLFCGAGRILTATGTSRINGVRGLAVRRPALAVVFGLGLLALLGLPPFSLFNSELGIARAGLAADLGWAVAVAFVLVLVIFAALARHGATMLLGAAPEPAPAAPAPSQPTPPSQQAAHQQAPPQTTPRAAATGPGTLAPLALGLAACAALGLTLGPLENLLTAAAAVVGAH